MSDSADKLNFDQIVHGDDYAPFALVVLNQPIQSPLFPTISRRASFSICADGGFNRLLEYAAKSRIPFEDILPQLIVGDLDSISKDALQLAQRMGVVVVRDVCQDTTDFQKALKALAKYSRGELARTPTVLAFGALDGRFDHTAASISVLYQYQHEGRLWLISNHSVVTLLHKVPPPSVSHLASYGRVKASSRALVEASSPRLHVESFPLTAPAESPPLVSSTKWVRVCLPAWSSPDGLQRVWSSRWARS